MENRNLGQKNYHSVFYFDYGSLDDGTIWLRPPSGRFLHIDNLTLRVLLETNSGLNPVTVARKYNVSAKEIEQLIVNLDENGAVLENYQGKITWHSQTEDTSITFYLLCFVFLIFLQINYFQTRAKTILMNGWEDGLLVALIAIGLIFFHELGHYITARYYFKHSIPKFGFTFLWIFPAIYVDTQESWSLPKNKRLLINSAGIFADLIVNTFAIALVMFNPRLEYYVTPFLITQYTRLSLVVNPLIHGDGYWILADWLGAVNLGKKGLENLAYLKFNWYSLFGLFSLGLSVSFSVGLIWFLANLFQKFLKFLL